MAADLSVAADREVRRLRFADAEQEGRFNLERQVAALGRVRIMVVLATFVVGAFGWLDVIFASRGIPAYVQIALEVRFLMVAPIWLLVLISTFLPRHAERADAVYAAATVGVSYALAYLKWQLVHFIPSNSLLMATGLDVSLVMLISGFTLPMRSRWLVGAMIAIVGGISAAYLATLFGSKYGDAQMLAFVLGGIALLLVISVRWREQTERRVFAQREQLEILNATLARLNAEKQEFMAIAAHDLRAPLAAVGGLMEGLQAGVIHGEEKTTAAHEMTREMVGQMLGLVDSYLGAHAAESAELVVHLARVEAASAAKASARRSTAAAGAKAQRIVVDEMPPDLVVSADPALLAQVLDNFVSNALKFSPRGAAVEIYALHDAARGRVRLVVADQGPGVPEAERAGLFRMFGRTSARPTAGEKSHGIGLAVTKRLAMSMGGAVGCESPRADTSTGAEFWVELAVA